MSELQKLQDLFDMGFITQAEYESRKSALGIVEDEPNDGNVHYLRFSHSQNI